MHITAHLTIDVKSVQTKILKNVKKRKKREK